MNRVDIDKMFPSNKLGCDEKGCNYFMGYKSNENNENNVFSSGSKFKKEMDI